MAETPSPLVLPSVPGSVVPPRDTLGTITYLVEGQRHNMDYAYHTDVPDLAVSDKVSVRFLLGPLICLSNILV